MKVIKDMKNPLLDRREMVLDMEHVGATLSRQAVKDKISAQFDAKAELVVVESIGTRFGTSDLCVHAKVYKDEATRDKYTPEHILARNGYKQVAEEKPEGE